MNINTLADITGDAANHQIASSGSASWIQFITPSSNSAAFRIGDTNISATRGLALAAGGSLLIPDINSTLKDSNQYRSYDLSTIYYRGAVGDKLYIAWGS